MHSKISMLTEKTRKVRSILMHLYRPLNKKTYYLVFSGLFAVMALVVYAPFLIHGKSFIFCDLDKGGDGLVQHYNSFVYYGKYLRQIIRTLWFDHKLEIPMWDLSIGFGQDIVNTLSYYVIGDPFSFFAFLFPTRYAEYGYDILILLRIYCAGLAFSAYCRHKGYCTGVPLIGSMIYMFCSYVLNSAVLHPYFVLPMIFLPLLLISADRIFSNKSGAPFAFMIALSGIANFYFFYMLCIMVFFYVIFNMITWKKEGGWKSSVKYILPFAFYGIIGVCASSVLLLPSVMNILSSSRLTSEHYIPILYDLSFYQQLLPSLISGGMENYSYLGFTGIGITAVILLFMRWNRGENYRFLGIAFLLALLFFCVPFFGHLFNGMSYVTNRWSFGFSFLIAWISVVIFSENLKIRVIERKILYAVFLITFSITLFSSAARTSWNLAACSLFSITITCLHKAARRKVQKGIAFLSILSICCMTIGINAYMLFSPAAQNYISNHTASGDAYELLVEKSPGNLIKKANDRHLYRFDTAGISTGDVKRNSAMLLNLNGTSYYYSSADGSISEFIEDLYMNYTMDQSRNDLNRRSFLDSLMGVKYMVIPNDQTANLPYGFNTFIDKNEEYSVYQNKYALPFGFTTEDHMTQADFNKLTAAEKQQVLLQTIVVEDSGTQKAEPVFQDKKLNFSTDLGNGKIKKIQNGYEVLEENSTMSFHFQNVSNCELYLLAKNFKYDGKKYYEKTKTLKTDTLSDSANDDMDAQNQKEPTSSYLTSVSSTTGTTIGYKTWKDNYYCGHQNFLGNLGFSSQPRNSMTITFAKPGIYTFDELTPIAQPVKDLKPFVKKLKRNTLKKTKLGTNTIAGTISVDKTELLCIQIPYSTGWTAKVDGQETEIKKADILFMAIELKPGTHQIQFKYESPYYKLSLLLSLSGFAAIVFLEILYERKRMG